MTPPDLDPEPGPETPPRRSPFTPAQTFVVVALVVIVVGVLAGLAGWRVGERDDASSFNEADAGFLADMTAHHGGAVSLAFEYLAREHDPSVAHVAREIITGQSGEIAVMNLMVADAGNPAIASDDVAMEWMGRPTDPSEMPGMASESDYAELRGATGVVADDVFTRLMIEHHRAGVDMAHRVVEDGSNPRVRRMAGSMIAAQAAEVDLLNRFRARLGLAPVAPSSDHGHDAHGDHDDD